MKSDLYLKDNKEIDEVLFGKTLSTFIISFLICFISIFGGLVLAVFLVKILIMKGML